MSCTASWTCSHGLVHSFTSDYYVPYSFIHCGGTNFPASSGLPCTSALEQFHSELCSFATAGRRCCWFYPSRGAAPCKSNIKSQVCLASNQSCSSDQFSFRKYKLPDFVSDVSEVFRLLDIPHSTRGLAIQKVSGALTNAVFFVSFPSGYKNRTTVVLRVYGPSSGSLISRPRELHILHILSSKYQIGPRILGTFENGRVEEYFESTTLTAQDIRDPEISRWIGARMAELHSVDIEAVEGEGWKIGVEKSVRSWLMPARQVLRSSSLPQDVRRELDIDAFERDWDKYLLWLVKVDDILAGSRRVFAHNDTQYGNLLKLKRPKNGARDHRQVRSSIFLCDFEWRMSYSLTWNISRSSWLTLNTQLQILPRMTSQTISMNGLPTITPKRPTYLTFRVIPL